MRITGDTSALSEVGRTAREPITSATQTPYVATVQYRKRPYAFFTAEVATPKAKDAIAPGSISGNFQHGAVTIDGVDPNGRSVRLVWPSGRHFKIEMSDPKHKRCYLLALACLEVARQVRRAIGEYS